MARSPGAVSTRGARTSTGTRRFPGILTICPSATRWDRTAGDRSCACSTASAVDSRRSGNGKMSASGAPRRSWGIGGAPRFTAPMTCAQTAPSPSTWSDAAARWAAIRWWSCRAPIASDAARSALSGDPAMKSPVRALAVGTAGIVCVVLIVSWAELVTGRIMIGFLQLPPVVLPLLFVLVLLNRAVARRAPRLALSAAEIAVAYLMMVLAAMITSRGVMEHLVPVLVAGNYYAGAPNRWDELYFAHIRPWLVPWNPRGGPRQEVARGFYEGYFYGQPIPWRQWAGPLAAWLVLMAAVFGAFLCLAALFRRPWVEQERLAFPLVQLPLEMIREAGARSAGPGPGSGTLLHNRLLWAGFALPAAVFTLNGLH